jgi:hypothetical protein
MQRHFGAAIRFIKFDVSLGLSQVVEESFFADPIEEVLGIFRG